MKNRSHFLLKLFFSLLIILNIKLYPQEIKYDIFQLNLGAAAVPYAINDSTEVVGFYVDGTAHAFHWADGILTTLSPGLTSQALSINNNSEIVGQLENNIGHYWSKDTTFSLLLPGTTYSWAHGINNLGNIVGVSGATAFYYDGTMNALSNPSGYLGSLAKAINDANIIVGYTIDDSQTNNGAVRWQNGVPVLLDTSYHNARPNSINNQNVTVGSFYVPQLIRAFMWVDNTVNVLDLLPGYTGNVAYDINDNNTIVGICNGGPYGSHACIWENGVIHDLNDQIPPDSNITLTVAWSINNKGEIVCSGYAPGYVTHQYLLKPITIDITKPKQSDKWMAGETDTIRWTGGKANEVIKIKYSTDAGNNFELLDAGINATDTMYVWDIPDTLIGRRSLIRIERNSNSEILAESDTFKIKPYIITRVDQNGEYVKYDINTDRWGFGNYPNDVWPSSWWYGRFDYNNGIDPFTNSTYSQTQGDSVFYNAFAYDHPDWISFVNTFGVDACYRNAFLNIYNGNALQLWNAKKGFWGGSCFGIAVSNALVFQHKDEFRRKYQSFSSFTDPISVTSDTNVILVVNELFIHQYGIPHISYLYAVALSLSPSGTIGNIKNMLKEDSVVIRTLGIRSNSTDPNNQGCHSIIAYRLKRDSFNPNIYYVYVYDNSYPNLTDARIVVDVDHNGGVGLWDPEYGWDGWEGEKGFYLRDPIDSYLNQASFPNKIVRRSPFILTDSLLRLYNPYQSDIVITNSNSQSIGISGSNLIEDIPNAYFDIPENGSVGRPKGYVLPTDNYSIMMNNFTDSSDHVEAYIFSGNKTFTYKRSGTEQTQTDRLFFDGSLSVTNPDNESKTIKLLNIVSDTTHLEDRLFVIRHLDLLQNDSVKIENVDNDKLKLTSYGLAKDYGIGLEYTSQSSFGLFGRLNIQLSANTTHTFVPNWSDISNSELTVYIDLGNNGTIDDTLYLQNEITSVGEEQGLLIPTEYKLEQNYPNPFNNSTVIIYSIPKEGVVTLKIYNAIGEEVTTIVNEVKQPGNYPVTFSTENLPSGVYFYRLQAGSFVQTRKMLLLK